MIKAKHIKHAVIFFTFTLLWSPHIANAARPAPAKAIKPWTFIVYIAADNNLHPFAIRNLKQMARIGSNNNVNIVAQLNIKVSGNKKTTRRYYIEKDKILHMNANDPTSQRMDSGTPQSLISCCKWAIENYPAQHYALVLWNHGTGIIDPGTSRIINTTELFFFNPKINKLELDRSTPFLDLFTTENIDERGICWDDTTGNYINNQGYEYAMQEICKTAKREKIDLVCFDACLMAMLEVADISKDYAHITVGSQEVEYGTGWDYSLVLSPFERNNLTPQAFAKHIVASYEKSYTRITNDFTQSAINLDKLAALEDNVDIVAKLLLDSLKLQSSGAVKKAIKASRNKLVCTHFDEPSYIDLHHLYRNLLANLKYFAFKNRMRGQQLIRQLKEELQAGCALIEDAVLASVVGKNLRNAKGISIYFPERRVHSSYRKSNFAKNNRWSTFITQYLLV